VKQLGDILVEDGLVTHTQLAEEFDEHQRAGRALGRVLVDRGVLSESQLVAALAKQIGMRFVDLSDFPVDGAALASVPQTVARRYNALPIGYEDGKLMVAMSDPANVFALDDIRSITGIDVKPVVATKADVLSAINRYHRAEGDLDDLSMSLDVEDDEDLSNL
jgi:type IV pilus assembly protein PilB